MKTANQQIIEQLKHENENLRKEVEYLKSSLEQLENKSVWDSVKNKENIKYISEEIILYLEKFRGNNETNKKPQETNT